MWKEVWIIMLVLAFVCLAIAILLTFIWDIINLIDELSGRKAKRQIRMLHELNSSTSTFDKLSTNEIYSGISSGTLLNEELNNTYEEEVRNHNNQDMYSFSSNDSLEESSTSFLEDSCEDSTSYLEDNEDDSTSYLSSNSEVIAVESKGIITDSKITILEEQSSL